VFGIADQMLLWFCMTEDETDEACGMWEGGEEWIQVLSRQVT
jgi:hypothetical protein